MSHQIEVSDTVPGTVFELHPVGAPAVTYLDPPVPVVEALDPAILVRATGLAELEPVAAEARKRLAVAALSGHEPFAFTTLAIRLVSLLPQRKIVTLTTNVPGPSTQLAMLGRPVLEVFPYVPIALRLRTGVAALSYHDQMNFGITADFDSNPDVTLLGAAIEHCVADLTAAAELPVEATS